MDSRDNKEPPADFDPKDPTNAPEVAYSCSPIPVYRENEGPEAVVYGDAKEAGFDDGNAHYAEPAGEPVESQQRRPWYKRKRWLVAIVLAIIVVAGAVGGGIAAGVGGSSDQKQATGASSSESQSPDDQSQDNESASAPSPTTTSDDSASSTGSAAVAPATSGVADFSCSNGTTLFSAQPQGLAYIQHCNTMYAFWNEDVFAGGKVIPLRSSTKYSFEDCINDCDDWNEQNPEAEQPCRSVSYYANLTMVFAEHKDWKGNCLLKSGVSGVTTNNTIDDTIDWAHTASAYQACLEDDLRLSCDTS